MATGDIANNIQKVIRELNSLNYHGVVDISSKGVPSNFLLFIHHIVLEYSPYISQFVSSKGFDLHGKKDKAFLETIYKLLRDEFNYKPVLSKDQFFTNAFAERKLLFISDLARIIKQKHQLLVKEMKKNVIKTNVQLSSSKSKSSPKSSASSTHTSKSSVMKPRKSKSFISENRGVDSPKRSEKVVWVPKPYSNSHDLATKSQKIQYQHHDSSIDSSREYWNPSPLQSLSRPGANRTLMSSSSHVSLSSLGQNQVPQAADHIQNELFTHINEMGPIHPDINLENPMYFRQSPVIPPSRQDGAIIDLLKKVLEKLDSLEARVENLELSCQNFRDQLKLRSPNLSSSTTAVNHSTTLVSGVKEHDYCITKAAVQISSGKKGKAHGQSVNTSHPHTLSFTESPNILDPSFSIVRENLLPYNSRSQQPSLRQSMSPSRQPRPLSSHQGTTQRSPSSIEATCSVYDSNSPDNEDVTVLPDVTALTRQISERLRVTQETLNNLKNR
ncbi:Centrosomal spindle body, CEP44-domain-containing protein [Paraphysoderma sedebokerense]|nr:Centrosomal spindle body, CEP44-domain-containing protein [Paraphysoderma sedebokerense]